MLIWHAAPPLSPRTRFCAFFDSWRHLRRGLFCICPAKTLRSLHLWKPWRNSVPVPLSSFQLKKFPVLAARIASFFMSFKLAPRRRFSLYMNLFSSKDVLIRLWFTLCRSTSSSTTWGDVRSFWIHGVLQGWVLGAHICGPWSQARYAQAASGQRGPRPLRAADALWGLTSLSIQEAFQVSIGNDLLLFSIELLFTLASRSGFGIIERPMELEDATRQDHPFGNCPACTCSAPSLVYRSLILHRVC